MRTLALLIWGRKSLVFSSLFSFRSTALENTKNSLLKIVTRVYTGELNREGEKKKKKEKEYTRTE